MSFLFNDAIKDEFNKSHLRSNVFNNFFFFLNVTTTHPWCDGHFTGISSYGVWGVRVRIQVSKMELHAHIHLD